MVRPNNEDKFEKISDTDLMESLLCFCQIQIQRNQSIIIDKAFDHKMCKWHQEA